MGDEGLAADMLALLGALESLGEGTNSAQREEPNKPPTNQEETPQPPPSLEEKLGELMGALRANGKDDWEGKPRQEDLGLRFFGGPAPGEQEAEEGDGAKRGLDELMGEYLGAVARARRREEE
ncbi:hypothetical protein LSM04_001630 [Trypanosoma melophagium]|uniref:uncharacterized protein n=1 Tax=Trypanosoma melophagium TaxID=715481 RepID=UPI003519E8AB|nr:hypothetical protein LSM04_001630 [Trypanosoma melophagium]